MQREVEKTHKCNKARSSILGRLWPSDDDDDNDIDDDNVYNQKDQCVIKALGGQNMTVCPIVVVPSQALRTGGESPFSGGTMFFYGSSWYNYAKSIFQNLNEKLNELFNILGPMPPSRRRT